MNADRFKGAIVGKAYSCGIHTLKELAEGVHIEPSTLTRNLNDPKSMRLTTALLIFDYLNMSAEESMEATRG